MSQRIVVVGSGFAGLWAAVGAARQRDVLSRNQDLEIVMLSRVPYHGIRVRYYEADLSAVTLPLDRLLPLIGVGFRTGDVTGIDPAGATIDFVPDGGAPATLAFDRLVLAAGSALVRPQIPGGGPIFDVDSFEAATRLARHLEGLATLPAAAGDGRFTAVVIGGGFTGLEAAADLIGRLRAAAGRVGAAARVLLVDHGAIAGSLGRAPQPQILEALTVLGVEVRPETAVVRITADTVTFSSGEQVPCRTVLAAAGMRASPLARCLNQDLDRLGRLPVDPHLRVIGHPACFAAGDVARALVDDGHVSVMSCQHARPQGRIAGHNVVADLSGAPLIAYRQPAYVTVLDLGSWGALYMEGWDRQVVAAGEAAKATKRDINHHRIYPPVDGDRAALLAASAPVIQAVPKRPAAGDP
jgi:NADH dehydrogenase